MRLHKGLNLNSYLNINSICWPTVTPAVGLQVTASGWGYEWQHLGLFGNSKLLKKVIIKSLFWIRSYALMIFISDMSKASLSIISDTQCRESGSTVGTAVLCAWGIKDYTCSVSSTFIIKPSTG